MIAQTLEMAYQKFHAVVEKISSSQHWLLYTVILSTALSIFMSFPRKEVYWNVSDVPQFMGFMEKVEAPFTPLKFEKGSHESKLSFRLTMPVLAHCLKMNMAAIKLFEFFIGILFFYITAKLIYDITSDKIFAFIGTLSTGLVYPGASSFIDLWGTFDGLAYCLLLMSMLSRNPFLILFFVATALFTDERAMPASCFVILFHIKDLQRNFTGLVRSLANMSCMAVVAAWIIYLSGRFYLSYFHGLETDKGNIGLHLIPLQLNNFPAGLWSGIEGFWIILLLPFIPLIKKREYIFALLYFMTILAISALSMSVFDITRSMAYMFPAVFTGLKIISENESKNFIKHMFFCIFLLSLLWPTYFVGSKDELWWFAPYLPIQMVRSFFM